MMTMLKDMFKPRTPYEKEHDFKPNPSNHGLCAVCGFSLPSTTWGRVQVWSYEGQMPGKCNLPVEESMES